MDTKLNHVQNYFASDPTQSSCPCPETELWQSEFRSVQVLSQSGAVEEHVLHYGQPHSGLSAWTFVRDDRWWSARQGKAASKASEKLQRQRK